MGSWLAHSVHAADERPNVIVILCDDLGYGDVGIYGSTKFKTPNIDKLAASGARLTHFYTPYPYCAPTRASLQTGRYPARFGLTTNPTPDAGVNDLGIPAGEITLGEAFKGAGYATGYIGKWHLGHKLEFYPTRNGYDEYLGILYSNDMRPVQLIEGEKVVEYPVVQATLTQRYTRRATEFIEKHADSPFFLMLAHAMPHKPLAASEGFYRKSGAGLYGDVIAELDWSVGEVMATLDRLKLSEKTLVWFTSDNGPWFGGSTGGLRGMKSLQYEGGIRVPLIARWPGRIPAGHTSDEPAITMDIYATSLRAAGIAPPGDRALDGKDILPVLTSHSATPHDALYGFANRTVCTVRSGRWKLHRCPQPADNLVRIARPWIDPRGPDGVTILAPCEQYNIDARPGPAGGDVLAGTALFDLKEDPGEQHNVAADHPDEVARLATLITGMESQLPQDARSGRTRRAGKVNTAPAPAEKR